MIVNIMVYCNYRLTPQLSRQATCELVVRVYFILIHVCLLQTRPQQIHEVVVGSHLALTFIENTLQMITKGNFMKQINV